MKTHHICNFDTAKTIPFSLPWDDAPLDISFMFEDEKPAGKHGFLKSESGKFIFEDGTEPRFWGTLFNSATCFPSHLLAEKRAKRLAKFGINIVRMHQFDAEWAIPNIFQFTRGKEKNNTLSFDPESLDLLDYFIYCLKAEGIYIYLDLLVYRTFKQNDGVDNAAGLPPNGAKPYSIFDRQLIELQKQYNYNLFTHVNPYINLAYCDDPAIALTQITNENDMFNFQFPAEAEPYRSQLEKRYREWAAENNLSLQNEKISFDFKSSNYDTGEGCPSSEMLRFLHEVQRNYCREMYEHLRSIGVKIPIAGDAWNRGLCLLSALQDCDFTDSHTYWDLCGERLHNKPSVYNRENNMLTTIAGNRCYDKPLFISEWDMTWPHEWRAYSALQIAAAASFQDWNGVTIHAYRYRNTPLHQLGEDILGGIPYRRNFTTFIDPAKFGLFYAAAILYRRGDVTAAEEKVAVQVDQDEVFSSQASIAHQSFSRIKALEVNVEKHMMGIAFGNAPENFLEVKKEDTALAESCLDSVTSDTGELYRNWQKGYGWIDTPCSKGAYGFFYEKETVELQDAKFSINTPFATIILTSLTEKPLCESSNILLTAVGRADNTGAKYNEDHTERLAIGHEPILIEVIEAQIELKNVHKDLRVWSVASDGAFVGCLPCTSEAGILKFEIGTAYPSMYYLICQ